MSSSVSSSVSAAAIGTGVSTDISAGVSNNANDSNDASSRCRACGCIGPNPGQALSESEIAARYRELDPRIWTLSPECSRLSRSFVCKNWAGAISYINAASVVAEEVQHHPDIHLTTYRNIEVVIFSHYTGGLTSVDFTLAKALEAIQGKPREHGGVMSVS
jgi:4a-hydroxytetrahydrobiopterin dehydratase